MDRRHDKQSGESLGDEIRVTLLGGFTLALGLQPIPAATWRLRKAQSLVKLLALAPNYRLRREQIMDQLWPELDPAAATNNFHYTLHKARRLLAAPSLLTLHDGWLALGPTEQVWVDVIAFTQAAHAARQIRNPAAYNQVLAYYGGDLLPDDRYEDWAAIRREELRALYLALLDELAQIHETHGDDSAAIAVFQQIVRNEPTHEEAHASLMRLYSGAGQRYQALRQYQQVQTALRSELNLAPAPETQRLYQEIVTGRLPVASPKPLAAPVHRQHNLPTPITSFIGRTGEIAAGRAAMSSGRLLTITGAGGCGKTRLTLALASEVLEMHPDGVWLVELAPLADPALILPTIAKDAFAIGP